VDDRSLLDILKLGRWATQASHAVFQKNINTLRVILNHLTDSHFFGNLQFSSLLSDSDIKFQIPVSRFQFFWHLATGNCHLSSVI